MKEVIHDTERDASPEEHQRVLERAQCEDFYRTKLIAEGISYMTTEGRTELDNRVNAEMERREKKHQEEAAAKKVIPWPARDEREEEKRRTG